VAHVAFAEIFDQRALHHDVARHAAVAAELLHLIDACVRDRDGFRMDPWRERMARIVADRDAERGEKTAGLISESLG